MQNFKTRQDMKKEIFPFNELDYVHFTPDEKIEVKKEWFEKLFNMLTDEIEKSHDFNSPNQIVTVKLAMSTDELCTICMRKNRRGHIKGLNKIKPPVIQVVVSYFNGGDNLKEALEGLDKGTQATDKLVQKEILQVYASYEFDFNNLSNFFYSSFDPTWGEYKALIYATQFIYQQLKNDIPKKRISFLEKHPELN